MKRTSITLPAELKKQAMAEAKRRRISFGEFVREGLDEKVLRARAAVNRPRRRERDPVFRLLDHMGFATEDTAPMLPSAMTNTFMGIITRSELQISLRLELMTA